jgi:hypothetical protein
MASSRQSRTILILILLAAVFLRVAVAIYLSDVVDAPPLLTDQRSYHALGARLVSGHGFSFDVYWYPFTPPDTPTAHWSFLYSFFVAAVYGVFGVHPLAVRLVQAVLGGILLPWMMYRFTFRLFEGPVRLSGPNGVARSGNLSSARSHRDTVALLAAGFGAVYAYFILYAATLMTETFFIIVLLWSLERALAVRSQLSAGSALGAGLILTFGLSLGIAALLRQSILPWLVVLFAWLLWAGWRSGQSRRALMVILVATVSLAILILPFTLRNYRVYGTFLLLNSNAGYAMYSAQHPMQGTNFQEFSAVSVPDDLAGLNEARLDRELMRRGIGFVLAEPGRYLLLSLSRVGDYFEFWPAKGTTLLHNLGRVGSFALFLPFMVYGIWLSLRAAGPGRTRAGWVEFSTSPLALVFLFMTFYSLLHILTWAMPRYRLPVDAVALSFAAVAVYNLGERALDVGRPLVTRSQRKADFSRPE